MLREGEGRDPFHIAITATSRRLPLLVACTSRGRASLDEVASHEDDRLRHVHRARCEEGGVAVDEGKYRRWLVSSSTKREKRSRSERLERRVPFSAPLEGLVEKCKKVRYEKCRIRSS